VAEDYCTEAVDEQPTKALPLLLLADAHYNLGHYPEALGAYQRVQALGADSAGISYNISLTYHRMGNMEASIRSAKAAYQKATTERALRGRSLYLEGDGEAALWEFGEGDESHFEKAKYCYERFVAMHEPKHFAYAQLACLSAVKAGQSKESRIAYEEQSLAAFDAALGAIEKYQGNNADREKAYFVNEYARNGDCGAALSDIWNRNRPSKGYEERLLAVVGLPF